MADAAAECHPPLVRPSVIHSWRTQMMHVLSSHIALWFMRHPNWKIVYVELSVCVHVRVRLLANQTSAMAQQCGQSLFDIYHIRCSFLEETVHSFRSIFSIIIARYIINGRGHVAQLKLATQNEKSSNHRAGRFCTVMPNRNNYGGVCVT